MKKEMKVLVLILIFIIIFLNILFVFADDTATISTTTTANSATTFSCQPCVYDAPNCNQESILAKNNPCQACDKNKPGLVNAADGNLQGTDYSCKNGNVGGSCYCDYLTSLYGEKYVLANDFTNSCDSTGSSEPSSSVLGSSSLSFVSSVNSFFNFISNFKFTSITGHPIQVAGSGNSAQQVGVKSIPQKIITVTGTVGNIPSVKLEYSNTLYANVIVARISVNVLKGDSNKLVLNSVDSLTINPRTIGNIIFSINCLEAGDYQIKIKASSGLSINIPFNDYIINLNCKPAAQIAQPIPVVAPVNPTIPAGGETPIPSTPSTTPTPSQPDMVPVVIPPQTPVQPPVVTPVTPPRIIPDPECVPAKPPVRLEIPSSPPVPVPKPVEKPKPVKEEYFDVLSNLGWYNGGEGSKPGKDKRPRTVSAVFSLESEAFKLLLDDVKNGKIKTQDEFNHRVLVIPKEIRTQVLFGSDKTWTETFHSFSKADILKKMKENNFVPASDIDKLSTYMKQDSFPAGTQIIFRTGSQFCNPTVQIGNSPPFSITDPSAIGIINKYFSASLKNVDNTEMGLRNPQGQPESSLNRLYRKVLEGKYDNRIKNGQNKLPFPQSDADVDRS